MIVKLTEAGDLLGPPSKLKGFVHISFFEEMRLCRKKCYWWLRNGRIFYPYPAFEILKNSMWLTFSRRKSFLRLVRLWFFIPRILTIPCYILQTYFTSARCVKNFLEVFKIQNHIENVKNVRIFYPYLAFEILKNSMWLTFSRRKSCLRLEWIWFFIPRILTIPCYILQTYFTSARCVKICLDALKIQNHIENVKNVTIF